jgi:hypothetical protein
MGVAYFLKLLKMIKLCVMKTKKIYLASLFILIGFIGISAFAYSQDVKQDKQARKEAKEAQRTAAFNALDSLLSSGRYVLEADYLQNKYGYRILVSSNLNFIRVNGPTGVLQTGSDFRVGSNGVGGTTAEGTIGDYRITRDKKNLTCTVTFNLLTNIGAFNIILNVNSGNNANATITGTTSGRLTWDGHLTNLDNSRVFKGQNTI